MGKLLKLLYAFVLNNKNTLKLQIFVKLLLKKLRYIKPEVKEKINPKTPFFKQKFLNKISLNKTLFSKRYTKNFKLLSQDTKQISI